MGAKDYKKDYNDFYTVEEYLALEEVSDMKHEYLRGRVRAMSGGTINHSILGGNIVTLLNIHTKGKGCIVLNSDARIRSEAMDSFVYPDASVVCGGVETSDKDPNAITNPMLVVEVLSKSTGGYDRGDKFRKYRSFPSFKEYVLIDQDRPIVDVCTREGADLWRMVSYLGLDKEVKLYSLDISIRMEDIYLNTLDLKPPNERLF